MRTMIGTVLLLVTAREMKKKTKPMLILSAALYFLSPNCFAQPLKVFILAGQSNMEGHAEIRTFDYIGKDPATAPLLKEMRNPDGSPRVCDNVWMSYLTGPYDGSANGEGLIFVEVHSCLSVVG